MNEQDALLPDENGTTRPTPFNPDAHGLWRSMVKNGHIDDMKWKEAVSTGGFVGTCRRCGDYMIPGKPVEVNGRTDYEARCRNMAGSKARRGGQVVDVPCDYVMNAPGGRTYAGTTRGASRKRG